jgi:hypothetical protein
VSCQLSSSPPLSSGSIMAASSTSPATLRWPLCRSVPRTPLLHHPSQVQGQVHLRQLPQSLHGCGRSAWKPASPRQTARFVPKQSCRNRAGPVFRPTGFFTFFSGAAMRWSRNCFPTWQGGFCMPGTGGIFTVSTDRVPVPSKGTPTEVRPLTSSPSSQGQSSGGSPVEICLHPWLMVKPVGCTLTSLYSPCI